MGKGLPKIHFFGILICRWGRCHLNQGAGKKRDGSQQNELASKDSQRDFWTPSEGMALFSGPR
jgi:hypothetical protein